MTFRMHAAVLTIALWLAAGCSPEEQVLPAGSGETQVSENPIYGGSAVSFNPRNDPASHYSVVSLHEVTRKGIYMAPFCSGTLVDPTMTVVLTAGHCVYDRTTRSKVRRTSTVRIYANPDNDSVLDDSSAAFLERLHEVSEIALHPGYNGGLTPGNDIALIRLRTPAVGATATWTPPLPDTAGLGFTAADIGIPLDFVGYGRTWFASYTGYLQHVTGELHALGCGDIAGCGPAEPTKEIGYLQNSDPRGIGPCNGDSGGPAFISRNGVDYVAGITARGDAACTQYGLSTRVDAHIAFVRAFIGEPECYGNGDCSDGNACTIDTCNNGSCVFTPVPDNTGCNGGVCCGGACSAPACLVDADCADAEACTIDLCLGSGSCAASCTNGWPSCGLADGCCGPGCSGANDPDCSACLSLGASCTANADCCSGSCGGKKGQKTCR